MPDLLVIEVSPFGDQAISRAISTEFLVAFKGVNPDAIIVTKDLAIAPVPHLDAEAIRAFRTPEAERSITMQAKLDYRLGLISEVNSAKHILISTPMWNFAVPSVLKAWIDQLIIAGSVTVSGKVTIIIAQGGSYAEGAPRAGWDWESGYLRQLFSGLGATDIEIILSEFGLAGVVPVMAAFIENKVASIAAAKEAARVRALA